MAPSKDQQQSVVLAVQILAVTAETPHQREAPFVLRPTAFARVIAWSHGQVSVDTGDYAEWGEAKPVLLPLGAPAVVQEATETDAAIELEVSLWDKQQTGRSGQASKVMLDAVAEVNLPAPEELGTSEKQATEK